MIAVPMSISLTSASSATRRPPEPVLRLDQLIAGARQQIADDLPVVLGVFDAQDAVHCAAPNSSSGASSTGTGRVARKVAPWPSSEATEIVPPCISTMRLE